MRSTPTYSQLPKSQRFMIGLAHGISVMIGLPTLVITGSTVVFLICPVISYLICRRYRKLGFTWQSSQAFQGTVANLVVGLCVFTGLEFNLSPGLTLIILGTAFLLALYTLWGALDTILGFDFDYLIIGKVSKKVSEVNQSRKRFEDPYSTNTHK